MPRVPEGSDVTADPHTVGTTGDAVLRAGVLVAVLVALFVLLFTTDGFGRLQDPSPWLLALPVIGLVVALVLWRARHS